MGEISENNKYLSFYFSVCQIRQLCQDKPNYDDACDTVPVSYFEWKPELFVSHSCRCWAYLDKAVANTQVKREVLVIFANFPHYL